MSYIQNHPKRVLTGLTTILVAAGVAVGSGASFTATSANASNVFTAGTLTMANDRSGAILTANNMKPGDTQIGVVKIKNTGSLAGAFQLTETKTSPDATNFSGGALKVSIDDVTVPATPVQVASNVPVGTVGSVQLPTYASGEQHTYRFTVKLNSLGAGTADDVNQGKSVSVDYKWDAVTGTGGTSTSSAGTTAPFNPAVDTRTTPAGNTAVTP